MTTYNAKHNEEQESLDLTDCGDEIVGHSLDISSLMVDIRKLDTSKIKTFEDLLEIIQALDITIDFAQYPQLKKYAE